MMFDVWTLDVPSRRLRDILPSSTPRSVVGFGAKMSLAREFWYFCQFFASLCKITKSDR